MTTNQATLTVRGRLPSKKNEYKNNPKSGVTYIPEEVKLELWALTSQLRKQWGMRMPLVHPDMVFTIFTKRGLADRDNIVQTILDCMVEAGVLVDDRIAKCNGYLLITPAIRDENEAAVIRLRWKEDAQLGKAAA